MQRKSLVNGFHINEERVRKREKEERKSVVLPQLFNSQWNK